jgi:ribosomal-protein-alanine N-acetyltransferase
MSAVEPVGPEGLQLRRIQNADLGTVHQIEVESYSVPWSLETFRNLLYRPDTDSIVAEIGGRVVGYAVSWFVVDQGELGNIAVDAAWRRKGIARALVVASLDRARARGIRDVYLEVRRTNTAAQKLYRQLGFRQVGVRRGYYVKPAEDALVMRRVLQDVEIP